MKVHLSTATMTAAILVLASSALVGTNAMGAPSGAAPPASAAHGPQASPTPVKFTFKCGALGNEVMISNTSVVPVPAGMLIVWQVPKTVANGATPASNAISGRYLLKQPLAPGGGITLNAPPPSTGSGDSQVTDVGIVATFLRSCTVSAVDPRTIAPMPMQGMLPYSWPLAISVPVAVSLKGKAITSNLEVGCYLFANAQIDPNTYTGAGIAGAFAWVPFKLPLPQNEVTYNGTLNLSMAGSASQPPVPGNQVWCHIQMGGPPISPGMTQNSVRLILPQPMGAPSKLVMPLFTITLD